jgi:hypothetical protein
MKDKTETKVYYLLRFFRDGKPDIYAAVHKYHGGTNRSWCKSESQEARKASAHRFAQSAKDSRDGAYQFPNRSDAQRTRKAPIFEELLKGRRIAYGRKAGQHDESTRYFWEVVKVTETIVTSFSDEIVSSDAPPMLTIARSVDL